jgi:hypothetical protein
MKMLKLKFNKKIHVKRKRVEKNPTERVQNSVGSIFNGVNLQEMHGIKYAKLLKNDPGIFFTTFGHNLQRRKNNTCSNMNSGVDFQLGSKYFDTPFGSNSKCVISPS